MFTFFKKKYSFEDKLYNKILLFSRNKYFYDKLGLADMYQVRLMLVFFHFSFLIVNIKNKEKKANAKRISQIIFDNMFKKVEQDMREQTIGDVAVNKNMKILINQFYNIMLNCENYVNLADDKKNDLFKKYLIKESSNNELNFSQLIKYFNEYQSFCFDLRLNSVLKGEINFKYLIL